MGSQQIRSIDAVTEDAAHEAVEVLEIDNRLTSHSSPVMEDDARSVELSEPFVTRWSVLISTTNWEKGAIICAWRSELESQAAPATSYSDEAWSRRVGGVTSQHVGRLRRVYQRFGSTHQSYSRLYWTHFLAALDWDDAELWLEGAGQSNWSVSQMRTTRWEASGGDPTTAPTESEIVNVSIDEDFTPTPEPVGREKDSERAHDMPEGPRYDGPDFGDEPSSDGGAISVAEGGQGDEMPWEEPESVEPPTSPFASLPVLPVDVADALEQFKLAIIRHRSSQWTELSQESMLQTLDALRSFAMQ